MLTARLTRPAMHFSGFNLHFFSNLRGHTPPHTPTTMGCRPGRRRCAAVLVSGRHCAGVSRRGVHRRCRVTPDCPLPLSLFTHRPTLILFPPANNAIHGPAQGRVHLPRGRGQDLHARAAYGHPNFIALSVVCFWFLLFLAGFHRTSSFSPSCTSASLVRLRPPLPYTASPSSPPLLRARPRCSIRHSLPSPHFPLSPAISCSSFITPASRLSPPTHRFPISNMYSLHGLHSRSPSALTFPSPRSSAHSPPPALAHPTRSPLPALSLLPGPCIPYLPSIPSAPPLSLASSPSPPPLPASCPLLFISPCPRSVLPRSRHPLHAFYIHRCLLPLLLPFASRAPFPVRAATPFPFPRSPSLLLSPCSLADPPFSGNGVVRTLLPPPTSSSRPPPPPPPPSRKPSTPPTRAPRICISSSCVRTSRRVHMGGR
ncbi:hypothetical protein DFH09DRAFT_373108 [Mycena vulgaris]|nr:hypothetical protein DFH09DRAFT_373108 [Mycena vulgaris]